jgi:hypothetical protein
MNYRVWVEHSARHRTLEHMKRKSRVEVVEGTTHFRHACNAKMRRHKNVVVHSDFGPRHLGFVMNYCSINVAYAGSEMLGEFQSLADLAAEHSA